MYSSAEEAQKAIADLKNKPGFCDHPDGFYLAEHTLNHTSWQDGFSTMTTIHVKDKNGNWLAVSAKCLPGNVYHIVELYNNDSLGELRHDDLVLCEEREGELYAVKRVVE